MGEDLAQIGANTYLANPDRGRHSSESAVRGAELLRPRESLPIDSTRAALNGQRPREENAVRMDFQPARPERFILSRLC